MVTPRIKSTESHTNNVIQKAVALRHASRDGTTRVFHGNALEIMKTLPRRSYKLIFADPPFNINHKYDTYIDNLPPEIFTEWCNRWMDECCRLVTDDGSIVVAIGDDHAADVKTIMDKRNLTMRNWIIWYYTFGAHCTAKFGRDHTHILYYVRNPKRFIFNADSVRIESERQRIGDKRAHGKGRVPGDVWATRYDTDKEFTSDVWEYPRLVGNSKERTDHPCQMPISILDRLILALTDPNDIVLDPFLGSGTTAVSAKKHGRMCDGIELSAAYIDDIIVPRLALST